MEAILEFFVLFFLLFRWFLLVFGVGLILILIYLRVRKHYKLLSWPMNLVVLIAIVIIIISLYNIAGIDYGFALPPNFR